MSLHRTCFAGIALLLCVAQTALSADGHIDVVVPARKPSRPAHFHWRFRSGNGEAPQIGQFACGSYWVAPAIGDDSVTMLALSGNPEWKDDLMSCDADPITEKHGLLDSKKTYGNYDADENLLPKLPQTFIPKSHSCISLVAAMQRNEGKTSKGGTQAIVGNVADAYCVVTVMPKAPENRGINMIRPNITGTTKEFLTWDDFDLSRLPKYDFIEGKSADAWAYTATRWTHCTEIFGMATETMTKRRGLQFQKFSEGGRAFRAHLLIHDYASGMARVFNDDVMQLFSAGTNLEEAKPALAAMLAFGLDIYRCRYDYGDNARKRWSCGAGQSPGQFLPPVLAAALLRDPAKANRMMVTAATNHGTDPAELGPQELRQIHRGMTGVLLWGDGQPLNAKRTEMGGQDWRYWADFTSSKCYDSYKGKNANPSRGKKTACDPYDYIDGPANKPGSAYMAVSLGPIRSFAAVMILMPEVRRIVNTDDPIEYVDRVNRHGLWTWPDPVAAPAEADQETAQTWYHVKGAQGWGETWGPRSEDIRYAVEDGKGRFKSLHGHPLEGGYHSAHSRGENWEKIIALYNGPTYEDNVVGLDETVAPQIITTGGDTPTVYMTCGTLDAEIHYTLDGTDPTADSPVYTGKPVPLKAGAKVKAFAVRKGKKPSRIRATQ